MTDIYLYIFSLIAVLSALMAIFANKKKFTRFLLVLFLYSVSGIIALNNGGYFSFIIIVITSFAFFYKFIKNYFLPVIDKNIKKQNEPVSIYHLLIISALGAIIASLTSSNIWQGDVFFKSEITLINLKIGLTGFYYTMFLVILVSSFLIALIYKPGGKKKNP